MLASKHVGDFGIIFAMSISDMCWYHETFFLFTFQCLDRSNKQNPLWPVQEIQICNVHESLILVDYVTDRAIGCKKINSPEASSAFGFPIQER